MAGRFVTNAVSAVGSVFSGVGAALAPFAGTFTALTALWIADRTFEQVKEDIEVMKEKGEDIKDWADPEKQVDAYQYICVFLKTCTGWVDGENSLINSFSRLRKDLQGMNASPILLRRLEQWVQSVKSNLKQHGWPEEHPLDSWRKFYPYKQFIDDLKGAQKGSSWLDALAGTDVTPW